MGIASLNINREISDKMVEKYELYPKYIRGVVAVKYELLMEGKVHQQIFLRRENVAGQFPVPSGYLLSPS